MLADVLTGVGTVREIIGLYLMVANWWQKRSVRRRELAQAQHRLIARQRLVSNLGTALGIMVLLAGTGTLLYLKSKNV